MISYDSSSSGSRLWIAAAILIGIAAAVGAWVWQGSSSKAEAPAAPASAPAATGTGAVIDFSKPPEVMSDGRPSDFSTEEWGALKDAVSKKADGEKELKRITTYLRFQRGFEQWQALQEGDKAQRHELANRLLEQLPERLTNMEMTMGEGLLICSALLTDLEPDEAARTQKLEGCKTRLEQVAPKLDTAQQLRDAECLTEFQRRQAALVAEHQAKPQGQKDTAQLEKDIESARLAVYDGANCGR